MANQITQTEEREAEPAIVEKHDPEEINIPELQVGSQKSHSNPENQSIPSSQKCTEGDINEVRVLIEESNHDDDDLDLLEESRDFKRSDAYQSFVSQHEGGFRILLIPCEKFNSEQDLGESDIPGDHSSVDLRQDSMELGQFLQKTGRSPNLSYNSSVLNNNSAKVVDLFSSASKTDSSMQQILQQSVDLSDLNNSDNLNKSHKMLNLSCLTSQESTYDAEKKTKKPFYKVTQVFDYDVPSSKDNSMVSDYRKMSFLKEMNPLQEIEECEKLLQRFQDPETIHVLKIDDNDDVIISQMEVQQV